MASRTYEVTNKNTNGYELIFLSLVSIRSQFVISYNRRLNHW